MFWKRKILPKLFREEAAADNTKRCPFLKPREYKEGRITKSVEQECMKDRCEIWDEEAGECSVLAIAKLLRKAGETS